MTDSTQMHPGPLQQGRKVGSSRRLVVLLLALSLSQVAGICDVEDPADPGAAPAAFRIVPVNVYAKAGEVFTFDVDVETTGDVQAFDFNVEFDPAHLSFLSVNPHPEFDDDGKLFAPAIAGPAPGVIDQVRDSRHGSVSVSGTVGIVTLQFRAETNANSPIVVSGRIADPQGVQSANLIATCYVSAGFF